MVFSPAITPFAILLFIFFVQSLFHVSRLPKYTNSLTFSITSSCALIATYVVSSPNSLPLLLFCLHLFLNQPFVPLYLLRRHFLAISHDYTLINQCRLQILGC